MSDKNAPIRRLVAAVNHSLSAVRAGIRGSGERRASARRTWNIEALEGRTYLAAQFTASDIIYDWTHASPQFYADLVKVEHMYPLFAQELSVDLGRYGLRLTGVSVSVSQPAVQSASAVAADSGTLRAPARRHHATRTHRPSAIHRPKPTHHPKPTPKPHHHPASGRPHGGNGSVTEALSPSGLSVNSITYNYSVSPHQLTVNFSAPAQPAPGDSWTSAISVIELNSGSAVSATPVGTVVNPTLSITYQLSAPGSANSWLPDGNYVAVLHGAQIVDTSNNRLQGSDSVAGHDYLFTQDQWNQTTTPPAADFWFEDADVNRDRSVGFDDQVIIARNYGKPGTYSTGDTNYDGTVGFDDLTALSRSYGKSVPLLGTPAGFTASGLSDTSTDLAWSAPSDPNVTAYDVYRTSQPIATGVVDTSYIDSGLPSSTTYPYLVVSRDQNGDSSYPAGEAYATTYQLPSPSNVTATAVSTSEIDLTWTNNAANATAVDVWRSTDGQNYSLVATLPPTATAYANAGLTDSTGYFYGIQAVGAGGASGRALADTITFPAAPSGLAATASSSDVTLSWTDNSGNEDGFEIFRCTDGGADFSQIDTVPPNTTSYEDFDAPYGGVDSYYVKAVTAGGESAASNTASANLIGQIQTTDDTPANNVNYSVVHGQTLTIDASALLSNDVDPNGLTPRIANYTNPSQGALSYDSSTGTFTYTANKGYQGTDSFTYTATDDVNATSTTDTVEIQVTDHMPEASSDMIPVVQATDGNGNYLPYAGQVQGYLSASDPDGDPLTYSGSIVSGQGSFSLNPNTGQYTFTPSQSYTGPVTVAFTANDGILTSNEASLIFPGYTFQNDEPSEGETTLDGDELSNGQNLPASSNKYYSVDENGTLAVGTPGLLSGATDTDPPPDSDTLTIEGSLIESPRHGSVVSLNSNGSFVYQPNSGFTGRDWFTFRVDDGSKQGEYGTAFIDVTPLSLSMSVDSLSPGDPTAQFPPGPQGSSATEAYATLYLNLPGLPDGSTVTLSADDSSAVDVWEGTPGASGSYDRLGYDAGTSSYTWTINSAGGTYAPSAVYVVGLTPSDYDQVVFHLSVTPAPQTYFASPPSAPASQPLTAKTQPGTVPGKGGYLVAMDGTWDYPNQPGRGGSFGGSTAIYEFSQVYQGSTPADYHAGVGNGRDHPVNWLPWTWPNTLVSLFSGAFGGAEQNAIVNSAERKLETFYNQNPANRGVPLDLIGYSRGAFGVVKLANDLVTNGVQDRSAKKTIWRNDAHGRLTVRTSAYDTKARIYPWIRFVGLISPINQMGPLAGNWPTSLPNGSGTAYEATDNDPNNVIFKETYIDLTAFTHWYSVSYTNYNHPSIGVLSSVLNDMESHARTAGVPV